MAATLKITSPSSRWRQGAIGTLAIAIIQLVALNARADEATVYIVDDQQPSESAAFDIAVALGAAEESDEGVAEVATAEQVAYTQSTEAAAESIAGEGEAPAEPPAEVVSRSDEVEPLDRLEGPPKWSRILRPITEVTADATLPAGLLPDQVEHKGDAPAAELMPMVGDPRLIGGWGDQVFNWSAAKSWHHPLYFEEVNLERYGYQCHPLAQPFVSGAHFFLTVPTLPYQMTAYPPREVIYTLGHYRPGSRVPWQRNRLPWDPRAAAVEAGVVVGLVFLIP